MHLINGNLYDPSPINMVQGTPINVEIFSTGKINRRGVGWDEGEDEREQREDRKGCKELIIH